MAILDRTLTTLIDGTIANLSNGDVIFKLHSHKLNPIITPQRFGLSWYEGDEFQYGAIFNCGAALYNDKVILAPRVHAEYQRGKFFDESLSIERFHFRNYISKIWILISDDGLNFERYHDVLIKGDGVAHPDFFHGIEDVRIAKIGRKYWLIGTGKVVPPFQGFPGQPGDRSAFYSTYNFTNIAYHGIIINFDSRNTVVFPEAISGKYYVLLRFPTAKHIHLGVLEEGLNQLLYPYRYDPLWQHLFEKRVRIRILEAGKFDHEKEKIGPGPPPIKTSRGWLLVYHGVGRISSQISEAFGLSHEIERGYSVSAALLDLQNPAKVIARTRYPIYIPNKPWELKGNEEYPVDVPAVVFPMGLIVRDNKLLLYCGAGDKYVILLTSRLDTLIEYLWQECRLL